MKKLISGLLLFLYFVGVVGSIGYLWYYGEYHIIIGVVATAYLAYFKARDYWYILNDKKTKI